ncbi:ArpU family transcriptional regulator [Paenibacillus athensensis]|uniref:ArpU family transcriptional regulator n=1 Tax=Paenibacillus athensensis TaxID=1967502 RepID=A0A4Y8Q5I7_9BACL|nr:ArpU family phage packaging/lysis transcriptional regulator [Paenibacillus athensensis]MCD1259477.1 ArpU family transcriptional regulator [Paenibacillus athensensis]
MDPITMLNPETLDRTATRRRVEWILEQVKVFKLRQQVRRLSDLTNASSHMNSRNQVREGEAVYRTADDRLSHICEKVDQALACLESIEQEIVIRKYLSRETCYDFLLCHELKLSERTYRRIKSRAMSKLAYLLGLEVAGCQQSG